MTKPLVVLAVVAGLVGVPAGTGLAGAAPSPAWAGGSGPGPEVAEPASIAVGTTTRASVASNGTQGDGESVAPAVSADGRYVVFHSYASNLVAGDTNGTYDVFVHDRTTGTTTRASVASDGTQANDHSVSAAISADGRYVAYRSTATNLVAGDTNGVGDVFLWDRTTETTTRISVASDGTQADDLSDPPAVSADGRYITYASHATNLVAGDTNGTTDVFVWDRATETTTRISVASDGAQTEGQSWDPSTSGDGRFVTYSSEATNLAGGDTNGVGDVFLWDRTTETTTRISVASDGTQANAVSAFSILSADGRYVAYRSTATNLVAGDTNGVGDMFVWDRTTETTTRISVASDGTQANGATWSDVRISADGRYITYASDASNSVAGDTNGEPDVFVWDRTTGTTTRVSLAADGTQANGRSVQPAISADGRYIAYRSGATNLVTGDTNDKNDVFVWDRESGTTATCTSGFPDVPATRAFCADIAWLVAQGVTAGYGDGTYRPAALVGRQEMAAFLYRFADSPEGPTGPTCATAPFTDVAATSAFCGYITWLVGTGITSGVGAGAFGPNGVVDRQQMAAFMYRYANPGEPAPTCTTAPFPDVPATSPFCGYITWLVDTGVTTGYGDGTFRPATLVQRDTMAAFLKRLHTYLGSSPV